MGDSACSICEVPSCIRAIAALVWIPGLPVHPLCEYHSASYIMGAVADREHIRVMPLSLEEMRN